MEVHLIAKMGDDLRVVDAARVSFAKQSAWEPEVIDEDLTRAVLSELDQKLIRYLATHNHWTPFSHVQITMREKVPIFIARQRFKHMIGFTYNEVSRRYVSDDPEFFVPDVWRSKPEGSIKQGSGSEKIERLELKEHEVWDDPTTPLITVSIHEMYDALIEHAEQLYQLMIDNEVAPEQARMVLPQSMYTEYYVTGSLSAWARAYKLRIDGHAQKEIQELAKMWNREISKLEDLKYSWKALTQLN